MTYMNVFTMNLLHTLLTMVMAVHIYSGGAGQLRSLPEGSKTAASQLVGAQRRRKVPPRAACEPSVSFEGGALPESIATAESHWI